MPTSNPLASTTPSTRSTSLPAFLVENSNYACSPVQRSRTAASSSYLGTRSPYGRTLTTVSATSRRPATLRSSASPAEPNRRHSSISSRTHSRPSYRACPRRNVSQSKPGVPCSDPPFDPARSRGGEEKHFFGNIDCENGRCDRRQGAMCGMTIDRDRLCRRLRLGSQPNGMTNVLVLKIVRCGMHSDAIILKWAIIKIKQATRWRDRNEPR